MNGLKIEWGTHNVTGDTAQTVNLTTLGFPAFTQPPQVFSQIRKTDTEGAYYYSLNVFSVTSTSFKITCRSTMANTMKMFWFAIGY